MKKIGREFAEVLNKLQRRFYNVILRLDTWGMALYPGFPF